jgi:hypothetical protein
MTDIPKALRQLKEESGKENWAKIRKHLARFCEIQRQIELGCPKISKGLTMLVSKEYINGVDKIYFEGNEKMDLKSLISFTRNCIVTIRHLGYNKDLVTFITDDGTPQKKMNKKYPNL